MDEAVKLAQAAKQMAYKKRCPHLADDFSQWVALEFLEKRRLTSFMWQMWGDYIKIEFGRSSAVKGAGRVKRILRWEWVPLIDAAHLPGVPYEHHENYAALFKPGSLDAYICDLYFNQDYEVEDIAEVLELNVSQISRKLTLVMLDIKDRLFR